MERQERYGPEDLNIDLEEIVLQWKYLKGEMDPEWIRSAIELYGHERQLMQARINVLDALGDAEELSIWRKTAILSDMQLAFLDSKESYSKFLDEVKDRVDEELYTFFVEIGTDHLGLGN